ncbi:MAG: hypothetical protein HUU32_16890 [Calditrichaceae bacterium]|nr:hypothetical protein [Calditrichia bacterium]NUQ43068.1 hypothetical protein [Calditrichaceae bacterium]
MEKISAKIPAKMDELSNKTETHPHARLGFQAHAPAASPGLPGTGHPWR